MSGIRFTYKMIPLRMTKGRDISVDLVLQLENSTEEKKLISVDALILTQGLLGFDKALANKRYAKNIGTIGPLDKIDIPIRVHGSTQTKAGDYDVELTLNEHFQDFTKVMAQNKRVATIRVI